MKSYFLTTSLLIIVFFASAQNYQIGHVQVNYTDPSRNNRVIQTEIYYPANVAGDSVQVASGQFPVLVFGHGFVMVWSAYQNLWDDFVSQGYIMMFPRTEGNTSPNHAELGNDLAFLVTKMYAQNTNVNSRFFGKVMLKSAIMGHSMGGGASFLACENNLNVTTMITYAAANTNPPSITAAQNITIPSLVIAGQNDCVAPTAQHQSIMYDSLASSCKAYMEIIGGGHCYFANTNFNCSFGEGTCSPNPTITRIEQQDAAQDITKLWLDYFLRNNTIAFSQFTDSVTLSNRFNGQMNCLLSSNFDTDFQNSITVYPNPASTNIQITNFSDKLIAGIVVTDIAGKKVFEHKILFDKTFAIDVSEYAKGVYFFQLRFEDNTQVNKLVVIE